MFCLHVESIDMKRREDYIGIGNELKAAMKEYTAAQGRGRPTVDAHEAFSVVLEKMDVLTPCCTALTTAAS